ncbi:MAG: LptE family protein [Rikenellaceae bacterium]
MILRNFRQIFLALAAAVLLVGCGYKVSYTLSGASIPPEAKSFSVAYFPNNATMVAPILASEFTDALKEIFLRRTKLYEVTDGGDFAFEGEITNYTSTTSSVSAGATNDYSSLNRLTITVRVRFTNRIDEAGSFSQTFSAYEDYDSTKLLTEVEGELISTIVDQMVTDIFQAAAGNW